MVKYIVLDSESNGLWVEATKIHVLSWTEDGTPQSTHDYDKMREVLTQDAKFICHNAIRHDLPLFNKILGLKLTYLNFLDTLALSWYINFERSKHGVESYGDDYGIEKPKVEDWFNLPPEEYAHRCEEDVKINWEMWKTLQERLSRLYATEEEQLRLIDYLGFKMDCARESELTGVRLDVEKAQTHFDDLLQQQQQKVEDLSKAMPKRPIYRRVNKPTTFRKKDGTLSVAGRKWIDELVKARLPIETSGPINVIERIEDGNPSSNEQIKDWLSSLGWRPQTFKFVRDKKTGKERMIEQVRKDGELCKSVIDLIDKDPAVGILDGLTVINHRLAIFKSFLECHEDGFLKAEIAGLTNTFRFKHAKPLVNLPSVEKPWGKEIRGCMIAPEGHTWAGSDMVSLEDTTKRHYMKPLDPTYVDEMSVEGFDPHLNLAMFAGAVTQEDIDKHNAGTLNLKPIRKAYKAANYSCIYGVGAAKLAREVGSSTKDATALIKAYWERNWAIKRVSDTCEVKLVGNYMWLKNPVSGFWHNLRSDKDRFSTLNQSTGVYCFDTWLFYSRNAGLPVAAQFHDEQLIPVKDGYEARVENVLKGAIAAANNKLKLNVPLDVDVQFGKTYADVH